MIKRIKQGLTLSVRPVTVISLDKHDLFADINNLIGGDESNNCSETRIGLLH